MDSVNQPSPPVETTQKPGILSRVYMVFAEPSKLFGTLTSKTDWLIPLIIFAVIGGTMGYFTQPILTEGMRAGIERNMEKYRQYMTEEQYSETMEQIDQRFADAGEYKWYYPLIAAGSPFITFLIIAVIGLVAGNFIFGGKAGFWVVVNVVAYAALIGLLGDVVNGAMMVAKGSIYVYTGLGILKPVDDGSFLYYLFRQVDLFSVWRIAVTAIGLGVIYRMRSAKFMYVLFPIWIAFICLVAVGNMFSGGSIIY